MPKSKKPVTAKSATALRKQSTAKTAKASERKTSKSDQVLSLLRRKQGASLEEMQKLSGWQTHSVRGYLSGTVKKRLGLKLTSSKVQDGERRYVIVAG